MSYGSHSNDFLWVECELPFTILTFASFLTGFLFLFRWFLFRR